MAKGNNLFNPYNAELFLYKTKRDQRIFFNLKSF